jgi:hypothetical protein
VIFADTSISQAWSQRASLYSGLPNHDIRVWAERTDRGWLEYRRADDEVLTTAVIVLFNGSGAALMAAADVAGVRVACAVLAAVRSRFAALLASCSELMIHYQNTRAYRIVPPPGGLAFTGRMEAGLQSEIDWCGQLTAE